MLEKDIEDRVGRYAKKFGIMFEKFTSPSKRSVPDRLLTFPGSPAQMVFIEFKAPGKKPTPKQAADHEKRRAIGALVYVVDDIEQGKRLIDALCAIIT